MEIHTIGFTQRTAEDFFESLRAAGIRRLIDTRLNNTSQLAAFAKRDDLAYFTRALLDADYRHEPLLAPTEEMLSDYRKKLIDWPSYEQRYRALLVERELESTLDKLLFDSPAALLCSEHSPEHCHRRLAVEYLAEHWDGVVAVHL
jgi:uncharacterized protein (DUF488 family)